MKTKRAASEPEAEGIEVGLLELHGNDVVVRLEFATIEGGHRLLTFLKETGTIENDTYTEIAGRISHCSLPESETERPPTEVVIMRLDRCYTYVN